MNYIDKTKKTKSSTATYTSIKTKTKKITTFDTFLTVNAGEGVVNAADCS